MTTPFAALPWHNDNGRPAYSLPLIVDAPEVKRDISEWAKGKVRYDYWLCLRSGTAEWDARTFVSKSLLNTLEHGKTYKTEDIASWWLGKMPEKVQFIVEPLVEVNRIAEEE